MGQGARQPLEIAVVVADLQQEIRIAAGQISQFIAEIAAGEGLGAALIRRDGPRRIAETPYAPAQQAGVEQQAREGDGQHRCTDSENPAGGAVREGEVALRGLLHDHGAKGGVSVADGRRSLNDLNRRHPVLLLKPACPVVAVPYRSRGLPGGAFTIIGLVAVQG